MTNIVLKSSFGREVEIDHAARRFRPASYKPGEWYEWSSYSSTSRPIGLVGVDFLDVNAGIYDGWPLVRYDFVEFIGLVDEEPTTEVELWSGLWADWARTTLPKESLFYDTFFDQAPDPRAVPDVAGRDLDYAPPASPVVLDRWQDLLDAVMAASSPSYADFKIREAAEAAVDIFARWATAEVPDVDLVEGEFNNFFDTGSPGGDADRHFTSDVDDRLLIAVDSDGVAKLCVILETVEPDDFADPI